MREPQRGERRRRARLQHDGIAAGQGRAKLVARHGQRVVEGRDRAHDAHRKPEVVADAVLGACPAVERQGFTREPPALLRREAEQRDASDRLAARLPDRLAALERDGARIALEVGLDARGRPGQHVVPFVRGPRLLRSRRGRRHGVMDVGSPPARHRVDQPAVEGVAYLDGVVAPNPRAADEHPRTAAVARARHAALNGHLSLRRRRRL